ncbi:39S ribosomal protein L36, mitochondrial isoform X2 [Otolemur garnettii]|uniref:39S ribosomal protein L36, mitochondrial isoform X2 n=1 Tax=Otolemur garnettii TaxID=30611 RepID=UPI000C7EA289|nr:39S ribosomal protein L36, mitochondrial isoform X2 [Otolemur garnettii]
MPACAGAVLGVAVYLGSLLLGQGSRASRRLGRDMTTLLVRRMVASVVSPLLRLSSRAANPPAFSMLLAGPLRGAGSLLLRGPLPCLQPALGFKTKGVLKKRCKDCYLVKRRGRWFIYCKTNPRHKQRQM